MKDMEKTKEQLIEELESLRSRVEELEDSHVRLQNTERALRESEERFHSFMNNSPVIAFMKDEQGRYLYVNKRWEQEFNRTLRDVQGLSTEEVWPGQPGIEYREHDGAAFDSGETLEFVEKSYEAGGHVRYWWTFRFPMQGIRGRRCTGAVAVDITDREKAEDALRESEARLRLITETIEDVFWMSTPDITETIYVSPSYEKIWGRPLESVYEAPLSFVEAIHPEDRERVTAGLEEHAAGHWDLEYRVVRPDGTVRWIRDRGFPVRDEIGNLKLMTGVASDITDLKHVEEALRKAHDELERKVMERTAELKTLNEGLLLEISERKKSELRLRESEENFRTFFETVDDPIIVGTLEGRIMYTNPAMSEKLGYGNEELKEMHVLDVHPKELREEAEIIFAEMFKGNREVCPLPLVSNNGVLLPVETRCWFGKWSGLDCIFGICKDLSKEQEALQKFDRLFRNHPALMAVSNMPERRFTDVNDSFLNTLGFAREEIIGKTSAELGLFVQPEMEKAIYEDLEKQGRVSNVDLKVKRKDGAIVAGLFSGEIIESQGRKLFLSVMIDLTERKKAEAAAREHEERYRVLVENLNEGIFVVKDGVLKFANPRSVEFTGYSADELTSGSFLEFVHPDDREMVVQRHTDRMAGDETPYQYPLRIVARDGSVKWLLVQSRMIPWQGERVSLVSATDITLLKVAENALRESEELLSAVLDALPDVVGVLLPDYTVTRYNRAGYELLGLAPAEVTGRKCYELIGRPESCEQCATARALRSKKTESIEKYVPELGRYLWCTSCPLLDPDGNVRLVIERLLDITNRKRAEEALRESEAKFRFLAEHASDVLWTTDLSMRTTYVSPAIERVLGFTPEERIQQNVESQLTPESLRIAQQTLVEELRREREEGIRPDENAVLEMDFLHKNGSVVCLESVMKFIRDAKGTPTGIHGLSRDITERKKAEEALRKSEEFNRRLVDHAPFGILYLAGDGIIEYVNPAANRIAGIPEGQVSGVLGLNILELPGLQDRSEAREGFHRLLQGESISDLEIPYKSTMGRDTVLLVAATPRFGSDATVTGAIIMFTDISERKRAEELQRETVRFRAVADLAGGVAHNFNNLLQIVIGNLDLALMDLEAGDDAAVRDSLEQVLKSSRSGAEVVRRLQAFSHDDDTGRVSQVVTFDVSDVARQAASIGQSWVTACEKEGRKVSLLTRLKEGCLVKADKNQIFGVVVNLVRNAVEAIPTSGDVDLTTAIEGDKVVVQVRDTGRGINQENLERLFNPFFTTKAEPGAGLSLASGKKIVEESGGRILVDSVEGQGTTFTVLFPLAEKLPEPAKALPEQETELPITILVIDDIDAITDLMKSALTQFGHAVLTALSGEEGIEIFRDNPADVVICDLGMPGMSGWEVGERISALCRERGIPKTPFILLTAWADQELEKEKIARSGVDAVVGKPLKIQTLREVIREVLERNLSRDSDG